MSEHILEALAKRHAGYDVAINATRLIPAQGYLVEYEWWGMSDVVQCHVAFLQFTGDGRGSLRIFWTQFTHARDRARDEVPPLNLPEGYTPSPGDNETPVE